MSRTPCWVLPKLPRDISEQKAINDRIAWMARYDALTGLPNRVEFLNGWRS
ncbi:GGDEF domain-containing protein [Klebsiella pneumoniae subsp. pneumoniae]|nr:GGDEF domain-containing protein [Klebsiella pneumoniae subsp. pneumoniae]